MRVLGARPSEPAVRRSTCDGLPEPAPTGRRALAGLIDAALAITLGLVPLLGGLAAISYWLARDGLDLGPIRRRSIGKSIVGLRPVRAAGERMDLRTSVRRNWTFALVGAVQLLFFIPILGWIGAALIALAAVPLGVVEVALILVHPQGRRLGDRMARTTVVIAPD